MYIEPYENGVFYDGFGMRLWEKREAKVLSILEKYKKTKVLDLGCGKCSFLKKLARNAKMKKIYGVDKDPDILKRGLEVIFI